MSLLTLFQLNLQSGVTVVPGTASLTLTTFAPTVTAGGGVTVTPGTASLTISTFVPSILTPVTVTPGVASLTLNSFAPTVQTPVTATPGTASLTITSFAPTILNPVTVIPGTASLTVTTFAPTVTNTGSALVTPGTAALTLTTYAPNVIASGETATGNPGYSALFKRERETYYHYSAVQLVVMVNATVTTTRAAVQRQSQPAPDLAKTKRDAIKEAESIAQERYHLHKEKLAQQEAERQRLQRQMEDDEELFFAASILFRDL